MHPATVKQHIKKGLLPAILLEKEWRVREEDFQQFVESRKAGY